MKIKKEKSPTNTRRTRPKTKGPTTNPNYKKHTDKNVKNTTNTDQLDLQASTPATGYKPDPKKTKEQTEERETNQN